MTWGATANVDSFDDAATWFQGKFPVTESVADEMATYSGPRAWTIAGISQADVVQDVFDSLAKAIAESVPFDTWKREIGPKLEEAWGRKNSPRVQLIYRNATVQANNAGRWRQQTEPAIKALRPFLFFDATRPTPNPSEVCTAWDGTILPVDEFPSNMHPQLHHGCQSRLIGLRESDARRRGITTQQPELEPDEGFGGIPTESEWQPNAGKYDPPVWDEYTVKRFNTARTAERPRLDQ